MTPMPAVITIPIDPIALHFGPISIHWYGIGYAVAFLVGGRFAIRHVVSRGVSREKANNLLFWTIVAGLIGARLYYVVQSDVSYYLTHPQFILAVWQGGMAFYGAVFAGIATLVFLCWRWRISFWPILDGAAIFATIGQPIGRIGNIVNGDILGPPSSLPWATEYTSSGSLAPRLYVAYQPAAAYEALGTLCILGVLLILRRRGVPAGVLGIVYVALYAISQFFVPFLRSTEPVLALGLRQLQWTALAVLLIGVPLLLAAWAYTGHGDRSPSTPVSRPA